MSETKDKLLLKNLPFDLIQLNACLSQLQIIPTALQSFGRRRALLSFKSAADLENAYIILQNAHINGKPLRVSVFGQKPSSEQQATTLPKHVNKSTQTNVKLTKMKLLPAEPLTTAQLNKYVQKLYACNTEYNFMQPPPPYLKYYYPKITPDILDAISIALMSNISFYTQVLHLMNRMNLEPPFGVKEKETFVPAKEVKTKEKVAEKMLSESESEWESDKEDIAFTKRVNVSAQTLKRKEPPNEEQYKKKARKVLQATMHTQKLVDQFSDGKLKIELVKPKTLKSVNQPVTISIIRPPPTEDEPTTSKQASERILNKNPEITIETINKNPTIVDQKLTTAQLLALPIYKTYTAGEPSTKLYIKNLSKKVTIEDLKQIYTRYTNDANNLDIKLMQKGRMKGQAFVSFINLQTNEAQNIVAKALAETNGLILMEKPMIVCYGKQQLGLIDTIYVDGAQPERSNTNNTTSSNANRSSRKSSSKSRKQQLSMQPYSYLIAIDFEATCWENQAPPKWRESEIIEFPAVLINVSTGKVEAEFHKYIMPIESPRLSAYCTELTGITQKTVDNGIPLQTALMMFNEWLRKELRARNLTLPKMSKDNKLGNCCFVTWTDWDFGICLAKECSRKSLKKLPYFNQWIDARAVYRQWYNTKPLNFADALNNIGLTFEGRPHSGIDDAKNLAALMHKMVGDGAPLAITKDLTPFQLNTNCVL